METFKFKHPRRVYLYVLLSFLMCMLGASSMSGRTARNPIVKLISGPTYSDNGTEVTLKLWMYNYDGDNAHFIGDVNLCIDGAAVCKLNDMWGMISNVYFGDEKKIKGFENSGNVGSKGTIILNSEVVGNAQFRKAQKDQKCTDNSNTGKWTTIELQLSFNSSFSYRKHTVSVKGKWRDRCDDKKYNDNEWDLKNTLRGFVYPTNLDFSFIDQKVKFKWDINGWQNSDNINGKWVLYKEENGTCVKQAEVSPTTPGGITIARKDFRCLATYYITFLPNGFSETATVSGLTVSKSRGSHATLEGVCKFCQHGIFSYTTTDGKAITLASNIDFGSKILSHTVDNNGQCIIEFEGKFTRIPDRAFLNTKMNNSTIQIPNTVTSIGSYAFSNTAISGSLLIPNSVTEIGEGAFENCRELNSLYLPSNLKRIENITFKGCGFSGGLTIPNSVTEIGYYAFYGCNSFNKELILSENLKKIGSYAFAGCSGFSEGNLTIPNSVTVIGIGAFSDCSSFNGKLTLPENLTKIGKEVFKNCKCLSGDLTIPNSVTEIGEGAFYDCKGFNGKLSLPCNLSKIGNNAFYGCENLSGSLTIPETVKEIGIHAFYNCTGFTGDFVLPSALESIGINAFGYTQEKNKLVFQSLPKGMRYSYSFCNMKKCVNLSDASYVADDATVNLDEASYSRTMSNTWGTLMLPYKITLTGNEPYSLYKIETLTGNELVLSRLEGSVAAGTPCIVKRNGTESELTFGANDAELNMAIATTTVGGMTFRGTYWTKDVNSGYIIAKDCFWNVEELKGSSSVKGVKVKPFRAWLSGTSANAPAQLSMRIDGSTTGIDAIDALNDAEAEYYDLSGKRLDEPQKGVNIVRMKSGKTKKIIIK